MAKTMTVAEGRKAVATIAEMQSAFESYKMIRQAVIGDTVGHALDKGYRGKGFCQYDEQDNIVRSFDGRADAHAFYKGWVDVATELLTAMNALPVQEDVQEDASNASETPEENHATEDAIEAAMQAGEQTAMKEESKPKPRRRGTTADTF